MPKRIADMTEDELRRLVEELTEQLPLNKVQGLSGRLAEIDKRLKAGGL